MHIYYLDLHYFAQYCPMTTWIWENNYINIHWAVQSEKYRLGCWYLGTVKSQLSTGANNAVLSSSSWHSVVQ